jgi:hypothetical protein
LADSETRLFNRRAGRQLKQIGRHFAGCKIRQTFGDHWMMVMRMLPFRRRRTGSGAHLPCRIDQLIEAGKSQKEGFIDRTHAGMAQAAGNGQGPAADRERFAGLLEDAFADEKPHGVERDALTLREPRFDREVGPRIISDQPDCPPLDAGLDETLRHDPCFAGNMAKHLTERRVEFQRGRLNSQKRARDIDEGSLRHNDEICAHARKARQNAVA